MALRGCVTQAVTLHGLAGQGPVRLCAKVCMSPVNVGGHGATPRGGQVIRGPRSSLSPGAVTSSSYLHISPSYSRAPGFHHSPLPIDSSTAPPPCSLRPTRLTALRIRPGCGGGVDFPGAQSGGPQGALEGLGGKRVDPTGRCAGKNAVREALPRPPLPRGRSGGQVFEWSNRGIREGCWMETRVG